MAHKLLNSYVILNNMGYNINALKTLLHIFVAKSFFCKKKKGRFVMEKTFFDDVSDVIRKGNFITESEYTDQSGFHCFRFFELDGKTYCVHYKNGILLDCCEKKPKHVEPWRIRGSIVLS